MTAMRPRLRGTSSILPLLTLATLGIADGLGAQVPAATALPGITDSAIARGREVFRGPANCVACHGEDARGTTSAPDLTDGAWLKGAGSYEDILDRVVHGVPRRESSTGVPMPMRGWDPASDDDVRAVAAYVWWLSHGEGISTNP